MTNSILDSLAEIKKIDKQNMLGSLQSVGKQVEQMLKLEKNLMLPADYKKVRNVALLGMGGSALGMHWVKSVFADELRVPVTIVNDYRLPKFIGPNTLVIASSYSGNTEEAISAVLEAKKSNAKIVVFCSGGELGKMADGFKWPALVFTTENNPCNQPRIGLGFSIAGQLIILGKTGLLSVGRRTFENIIDVFNDSCQKFGIVEPKIFNPAKRLAGQMKNKSVWFVGSEHLVGNAHIAANQMNENGKRFAGYFVLPELNHHLLEGMANPASNKKDLLFVFLESGLYHQRVLKRYEITRNVLMQNNVPFETHTCVAGDKLGQACETLVFSGYLSYYCAMLSGIDPSDVPLVDYFKLEMSK